jgi:hypothetical protein
MPEDEIHLVDEQGGDGINLGHDSVRSEGSKGHMEVRVAAPDPPPPPPPPTPGVRDIARPTPPPTPPSDD